MANWWEQIGDIESLRSSMNPGGSGIDLMNLGLNEIIARLNAGELVASAPEMSSIAEAGASISGGDIGAAQEQLAQMPWRDIMALRSELSPEAQQTLSQLTARREEINVGAQQLYGMSIEQVESFVSPQQWMGVSTVPQEQWESRSVRGPRSDILLGTLGVEFRRMGGEIGSRAGQVFPYAPRTQREQIAEYGGVKVGRVQYPSGWHAMTSLQAQLEMTGTSQTKDIPETYGQRGESLAGPMELVSTIPGYEVYTDPSTGERMMNVPQFKKGVKRLWGAARTGRVSASGLESDVSQVVGVAGGPPERFQIAKTRIFFGPEMVSGAGAYGDIGNIQTEMLRKFRIPKGAQPLVSAGDVLSGGEPVKLFEGHTGLQLREEGLQDITVQHAFVREGKEYDELIFQALGTLPRGVPVGSKFGWHKEGDYYDPEWTRAMGVHSTARMNEPYQAAAAFAMANVQRNPELVRQAFGDEFFSNVDPQTGRIRWQPGMGQRFIEWMQGRIQQGQLPEKAYNIQDPLVAQAVEQGIIEQATQPNEQGVFRGQEWNAWVDLDMATVLTGQPAYNPRKRLSPDAITNIASTDPELARRLVEGTERGPAVSMLGAGLANLPEEKLTTTESRRIAERFRRQAVVIGEPGAGEARTVADIEAVRLHAERALAEQGVTDVEGRVGEQMLRSFGEMYPGRGMYFAAQGTYAPGGREALAYGFQNIEGELSQVPREMYSLMIAEQERQAGVTRPGGPRPASKLREQMAEVTASKEFVTQLLGAESKGVSGGGWVAPVQAMPLNRFAGGYNVVRAIVGSQIRGRATESDVEEVTQGVLSGKLDLRSAIWRDPSLTKEQRRMVAGYMTSAEAVSAGIVSSAEEYEQRFGSTLGVAPAMMSSGAGDWDLDVMKRITRTTYEKSGTGFVAKHSMPQSTVEQIQSWIMREPGGEHPGLMADLAEFGERSLAPVEKKLSKWASGEQISLREMGKWTQAREGIRGTSMGGIYNIAQRQISAVLTSGEHPALEEAQNLLATGYQLALDYQLKRVGPLADEPDELEAVRAPVLAMEHLAGLKGTTYGWKEGEEGFGRLARRERSYVEQAVRAFAGMRETSGALGTAEARAALLIHPERAPEEFGRVQSILTGLGEEPFGEEPSALQMRRREEALREITDIVMPEQTSMELRQPGRLTGLIERTTAVGSMLSGSYYNAIRRAQAENIKAGRPENYGFERTPGGGLRIPAYTETGELKRTNELTPEMVQAAGFGGRRYEYTGIMGRLQRYAQRGTEEGGIEKEEVLPRVVSAISAIAGAGEAPEPVARAWEQVMEQAAGPEPISAAKILSGRRGTGPVQVPEIPQQEITQPDIMAAQGVPITGIVQQAIESVGGMGAFGAGIQELQQWRAENVGTAPVGMRPTRQVLNRMYQLASARGKPLTQQELGEYGQVLAQHGVSLSEGEGGVLFHEYGARAGGAPPPTAPPPTAPPPAPTGAPPPGGGGFRPPSGIMPSDVPETQLSTTDPQAMIAQGENMARVGAGMAFLGHQMAGTPNVTGIKAVSGESGTYVQQMRPRQPLTAEQTEINRRFLAGETVFETQAAPFQQMTTAQQYEALQALGITGKEAQAAAFNIAKGKAPTGPQWGALAESIGGQPATLEGMLQQAGAFEPGKFADAVTKMTEALEENQPFLEKFGSTLREQVSALESGEQVGRGFGRFVGGMGRRAGQVLGAAEAVAAAGGRLTPEQQEIVARWQAVSSTAGGAQQTMAMREMEQLAGGPDGGGGGGQTAFGRLKRAMFGWAPMQMGRAWNMLGAPVFNQMIPAAAQAEMQGWQLTMMAGGYQGQVLPEGVAGGLIAQQAATRQNLIEAGRAGYRAWGTGVPADVMGGLQQAQGVLGPALGLGLGAGILTNALGFGAAAGPIGLGVAGVAGAIGTAGYLMSYGSETAENALLAARAEQAGGISAGWSRARSTSGRQLSDMWSSVQAGDMPGLAMSYTFGGIGAESFYEQQVAAGQKLMRTPMGQMSSLDRMAALNEWSRQSSQQLGMDEGQFLQFTQQFAGYEFMQGDVQGLIANMPEQLRYGAATGTAPSQFTQQAAQLRMGAGGQRDYFDWMMRQRLDITGQERATAMTGQYAGLVQYGWSPEDVLEAVGGTPEQAYTYRDTSGRMQQGVVPATQGRLREVTGYESYLQQKILGGDQYEVSRLAIAGGSIPGMENVPGAQIASGSMGLVTVDPRTGMQVGQAAGGGALYQAQNQIFQSLGVQAQLAPGGGFNAMTTLFGQQVGLSQWEIQDAITRAQRGQQDWQYQQQTQQMGMQAQQQYAQWGIQDQMTGLSRQHARSGFGFQWEQLEMQDQRFYENLGKSWGRMEIQGGWQMEDRMRQFQRQMQGFQWQREDLAFGAEGATLQQAWGLEDIEEQLRYATGRQRKQLMRQRDRMTIQFARQMGQFETQEGRLDTREEWAREDLSRDKERHETRMRWGREDMEQSRRYHEEDMDLARRRLRENQKYFEDSAKLQDRQRDLARKYWEDTHKMQVEAIEHNRQLQVEMNAAQDAQLALSRATTQQMSQVFIKLKEYIRSLAQGASSPLDLGGSYQSSPSGVQQT
jgi:hypothetical protein